MREFLNKKKSPLSILGLAFDGSRIEAVVLRRSNGSLEIDKSVNAALALNPFTGDPELVGREIRNRLDEAEIRERSCAVCVPLSWAVTLQTKLPDLPEQDIESFLQIEAERGFPYSFDALCVARSRWRSPGGDRYVTQIAIPREPLLRLEQVLKAARLKPVTFSPGILSLQNAGAETDGGVLAFAIEDGGVALMVGGGGGVAVLRTLEGAFEIEGGEKKLQPGQVSREARITLGHLPSDVRDALRQVRVFGGNDEAQQLAEELEPRVGPMGIKVEQVKTYPAGEFGASLPPRTAVSPALSLAARQLMGRNAGFEFIPPKSSQWHHLAARYSSKTIRYAAAAAAVVVLIVALAFVVQQIQLIRLRSQWSVIASKVRELDNLQQQIKKYRPWFDDSLRSLSILRRLTEAFPEDGAVSAKTVEIREQAAIICTGTARDSQALLKTLDQLRAVKEVVDVKVDQLRGKSPLQFTFNFQWEGQGGQ